MDSDLSRDEFEEVILLSLQKDLKTISLLIAVVIVVQGLLAACLAVVFWLPLNRPGIGAVVGLVGGGVTIMGGYVLLYNVRRAMTVNEQLRGLAEDVSTAQPDEESASE
jgi:uncharacterized membrane protein YidH (DUF202 family)